MDMQHTLPLNSNRKFSKIAYPDLNNDINKSELARYDTSLFITQYLALSQT